MEKGLHIGRHGTEGKSHDNMVYRTIACLGAGLAVHVSHCAQPCSNSISIPSITSQPAPITSVVIEAKTQASDLAYNDRNGTPSYLLNKCSMARNVARLDNDRFVPCYNSKHVIRQHVTCGARQGTDDVD